MVILVHLILKCGFFNSLPIGGADIQYFVTFLIS